MLGCGATVIIRPVLYQKSDDEMQKKAAAREELRQAAAEIFKNTKTDPAIENKGIYLGRIKVPSDRRDRIKFLDIYEAPEHLTIDYGAKRPSLENASLALAGLRNWHGHDGNYYANSDNICDALIDGRYRVHINYIDYKGQWFFPDMLLRNDRIFSKPANFRLCRAEALKL